jgi:hypothetical protein
MAGAIIIFRLQRSISKTEVTNTVQIETDVSNFFIK